LGKGSDAANSSPAGWQLATFLAAFAKEQSIGCLAKEIPLFNVFPGQLDDSNLEKKANGKLILDMPVDTSQFLFSVSVRLFR